MIKTDASNPRVCGVGLACLDETIVVCPNTDLAASQPIRRIGLGGMAATAVVTAKRLGAEVSLITVLADDIQGQRISKSLESEDIRFADSCIVRGGISATATVIVDGSTGDRWIRPHSSELPIPNNSSPRDIPTGADVLVVDGFYPQIARCYVSEAKKNGIPVVGNLYFEPGCAHEFLPLCDYLVVSEEVGRYFVWGDDWAGALGRLTALGPPTVAITRGEKGVIYTERGRVHSFPSFDVSIKDTAGAGDAFHGAFAYAIAKRWPVPAAIVFASAVGAMNCRSIGRHEALPSFQETAHFLSQRSCVGPWQDCAMRDWQFHERGQKIPEEL